MRARILIVDDEDIVLRSCLRILADGGHKIDIAPNGGEALRKVEANRYDLIIIDVMMPQLGGLEVLRQVKATRPDVAVIMMTGLSQVDTALQAKRLGAADYIPKPFEPDELKRAVDRALATRRGIDPIDR